MQSIDRTPQPGLDVTLSVSLTEVDALALAQFMKRVGWSDWRRNASDDVEAAQMREACAQVQAGLAQVGFAPR